MKPNTVVSSGPLTGHGTTMRSVVPWFAVQALLSPRKRMEVAQVCLPGDERTKPAFNPCTCFSQILFILLF